MSPDPPERRGGVRIGRRKAARVPPEAGHLRRRTRWAGLKPGDPVAVSETRVRGATWTFVAHVTNERTGAEWVEVVGGRSGSHTVRSFAPERVLPPSGARSHGAKQAPFVDAPRLPLD